MKPEFGPEELCALRPRLLEFALRRLGDRGRSEDAVHEALLAAMESRGRFAGRSSAETWVFGILKHKIIDRIRESVRTEPLGPEHDKRACPAPGPQAAAEHAQTLRALESGLSRLPERQARAFVLCELLEFDTAEACAELAMTRANLWVCVHRARRRLRELTLPPGAAPLAG